MVHNPSHNPAQAPALWWQFPTIHSRLSPGAERLPRCPYAARDKQRVSRGAAGGSLKPPHESDEVKNSLANTPLHQPEQSPSQRTAGLRTPHSLPAPVGPWAAKGTPVPAPSPRRAPPQRLWWWHPWNTSGEPALAKGREQTPENTANTPLLPAAAVLVPAGKRFSPPTSVSIVLEITFCLGRSEFLSSRGLSHPSPV